MSDPQTPSRAPDESNCSLAAPAEQNPLANETNQFQPSRLSSLSLRRRFAKLLNWALVAKILAIKGLIFTFAALSYPVLTNKNFNGRRGWLEIWNHWDSLRYLRLAEFGYINSGTDKYDLVGFPLFPGLVRICAFVFQDYLVSGFVVSGIASIAAGLLLDKLVRLDYSESIAAASVWFMFIFPTSYFLHINYTESLFMAVTLGCFLAARRSCWAMAGALGMLSCLTRVNGLVIIPALMVEAFQQYRETRRFQPEFLWILITPFGFGFYLLLNKLVTDDWFAFISLNREHFYKWFAPPWIGIAAVFKVSWNTDSLSERAQMVGLQEFIFILIGAGAIIGSWWLLRPAYTVWVAGNWLLFTSVGFILGVPRYTLTLFPIYLLAAKLAQKPFWNQVITIWSLLFLAFFVNQFIQGRWAFG